MTPAQIDLIANDKASATVNKVVGEVSGLGSAFKMAGLAAAGLAGAFVALGGVAIHEAMEAEEGMLKLQAALGDTANADALLDSLKEHAAVLQENTQYSDDFVLSLYATAAGMGVAQDQLQNTVDAALALSAATGGAMSVEAAMKAMTKATVEDEAALARFIPALKNVKDEAQRTAIMNETLARGQAMMEAQGDSLSGQLKRLWNMLMDTAESIGVQLLPAIHGITDYLADSIPTINAWASFFVSAFGSLLNALAPVGAFLVDVFRTVRDWGVAVAAGITVVWQNFGDDVEYVGDAILLAFVATGNDIEYFFSTKIPAYFNWFLDNWKEVFQTAWSFVSSVFTNMYTNVANFFQGVWSWLKGDGFDFTWTGLLDGFENTLQALPEIAERELSPLEAELAGRMNELGGSLADKIAAKNREFRAALGLDPSGAPQAGDKGGLQTPQVPLGSTAKEKKEKEEKGGGSAIVAVDELWKRISTAASPEQKNAEDTAQNTAATATHAERIATRADEQTKKLDDIHGTLKEIKGGVPAVAT